MMPPGEFQPNQISVSSIHINTEQTLIQITEDKLRLVLIDHLGQVESKNRWQVPLGFLLALVPILLTSEFKDTGPVEKQTWEAFFMFSSVFSACWFLKCLRGAFGKATLNNLIERIKNVAKEDGY